MPVWSRLDAVCLNLRRYPYGRARGVAALESQRAPRALPLLPGANGLTIRTIAHTRVVPTEAQHLLGWDCIGLRVAFSRLPSGPQPPHAAARHTTS